MEGPWAVYQMCLDGRRLLRHTLRYTVEPRKALTSTDPLLACMGRFLLSTDTSMVTTHLVPGHRSGALLRHAAPLYVHVVGYLRHRFGCLLVVREVVDHEDTITMPSTVWSWEHGGPLSMPDPLEPARALRVLSGLLGLHSLPLGVGVWKLTGDNNGQQGLFELARAQMFSGAMHLVGQRERENAFRSVVPACQRWLLRSTGPPGCAAPCRPTGRSWCPATTPVPSSSRTSTTPCAR